MFKRGKFQILATVAALFSVLVPANADAAVAFEPQSLSPQVRTVAPSNSSPPTVSGSASEGSVLSLSNGTWRSSPTSFAYTWYRCSARQTRAAAVVSSRCTLISGASTSSLTLGTSDVGRFIVGGVRAQNASGSAFFSSVSTAAVTRLAAPTVISAPVISGTSRTSETLSISTGSWTSGPTSYSYTWFRCTSAVTRIPTSLPRGCTAISGATQSTYRVQELDLSRFILGSVAATNRAGSRTSFTVTTAAIAQASRSAPRIQSAPRIDFSGTGSDAITGRALVGSVLVVNKGLWLGSPTPTVSHTYWYRCASRVSVELSEAPETCYAIPGSNGINGETYLVTAEDVNFFLAFEVIAINDVATVRYFTTSTDSVSSTPISLADPVMTGDPKFQGVLSVSNGRWASPPSIPLSFEYSWFRCESQSPTIVMGLPGGCEVIAGAESRQYTVGQQDLGFYIHGTVRAFNSFGFIAFDTAQSLGQSTSAPVNLSAPTLSGENLVGTELTVSSGDWASYPEPTTSYQWFRCNSQVPAAVLSLPSQCSVVSAATSNTYTQVAADAGRFITVRTTQTNSQGTTNLWSLSTSITNQPPTLALNPTISGTGRFGETLTVNPGTWQGFPAPSFSYQWYSCDDSVAAASTSLASGCSPISESTSSTRVLNLDTLVGNHLLARVTATNTLLAGSHFTSSIGPVTRTPTATVNPTVSGTRASGSVLTVSSGTWNAYPTPETTYSWYRCDSAIVSHQQTLPGSCVQISDANSSSYTQTFADAGKFITALTTKTNIVGMSMSVASATSATSAAPNLTSEPQISGRSILGEVVTTTGGAWGGFPQPQLTYQWYSCESEQVSAQSLVPSDCSLLQGSTSSSYTADENVLGLHLLVQVTATNSAGTASRITSSTPAISSPARFSAPPLVIGERSVGANLTVTPVSFTGFPEPTVRYQWFRCSQPVSTSVPQGWTCGAIPGATSSAYVQTDADRAKWITVTTTLSNNAGSEVAWARSTAVTYSAVTFISEETISGQAVLGSVMAVDDLEASGWPNPNLSYEWYSCENGHLQSSAVLPADCRPLLETVQQISAGLSHTCLLYTTGTVKCTGRNNSGQLGNNSYVDTSRLLGVAGITTAVSVSAGGNHTCALLLDGTIRCWGLNSSGQLGDSSNITSPVPTQVSGISTAIAISLGENHSCALLNDGTVRCWGLGSSGQIGSDWLANRNFPQIILKPHLLGADGTLRNVLQISSGNNHTCALEQGGTVRCWGMNDSGQLGNNSRTRSNIAVPVDRRLGSVMSLSAGGSHTCALLASKEVQCWGLNTSGQLGTNSTSNSIVPTSVRFPSGYAGGLEKISAGRNHTCAQTATQLWCWGASPQGGPSLIGGLFNRAPIFVQNGTVDFSSGGAHTCSNGLEGLKCWGQNFYGQFGNRVTQNSERPVDALMRSQSITLSSSEIGRYMLVRVIARNEFSTAFFVSRSTEVVAR